jgi:hypothetical protein
MDVGGEEMIRVARPREPEAFDDRCRKRGRQWLKEHPGYKRPRDYWSEFEPQLRSAFNGLCGYCAMMIMKGQIDHFVPVDVLKERGEDELAYEWSNFRYGEGVLNQRKSSHVVLDPYRVKNEWFQILLPSLQLVLTREVPRYRRKLAEFTLQQLGLQDSEVVVRYRAKWFSLYREGELSLEGLKQVAPLIANAVEQDLAQGKDWRK